MSVREQCTLIHLYFENKKLKWGIPTICPRYRRESKIGLVKVVRFITFEEVTSIEEDSFMGVKRLWYVAVIRRNYTCKNSFDEWKDTQLAMQIFAVLCCHFQSTFR